MDNGREYRDDQRSSRGLIDPEFEGALTGNMAKIIASGDDPAENISHFSTIEEPPDEEAVEKIADKYSTQLSRVLFAGEREKVRLMLSGIADSISTGDDKIVEPGSIKFEESDIDDVLFALTDDLARM